MVKYIHIEKNLVYIKNWALSYVFIIMKNNRYLYNNRKYLLHQLLLQNLMSYVILPIITTTYHVGRYLPGYLYANMHLILDI